MVAILLRVSAVTIRCCFNIPSVDIAFIMQITQDAFKACKRLLDVKRFFIFGIGFVGNLYVEVKAVLILLPKKKTANDPAVAAHEINGDGGDFTLLFQNTVSQIKQ